MPLKLVLRSHRQRGLEYEAGLVYRPADKTIKLKRKKKFQTDQLGSSSEADASMWPNSLEIFDILIPKSTCFAVSC